MREKLQASRSVLERQYFDQFHTVIIPCVMRYVDWGGTLTMQINPQKQPDVDHTLQVSTVMKTSYMRLEKLDDRLIGALWFVCRQGKHCNKELTSYLATLRESVRQNLNPLSKFNGTCSHCLTEYTFEIQRRASRGFPLQGKFHILDNIYDIKLKLVSTIWTHGLGFERISPYSQDSWNYISSLDFQGQNFEHRNDWYRDRYGGRPIELWTTISLKPVTARS
jgi:hypothetical protein